MELHDGNIGGISDGMTGSLFYFELPIENVIPKVLTHNHEHQSDIGANYQVDQENKGDNVFGNSNKIVPLNDKKRTINISVSNDSDSKLQIQKESSKTSIYATDRSFSSYTTGSISAIGNAIGLTNIASLYDETPVNKTNKKVQLLEEHEKLQSDMNAAWVQSIAPNANNTITMNSIAAVNHTPNGSIHRKPYADKDKEKIIISAPSVPSHQPSLGNLATVHELTVLNIMVVDDKSSNSSLKIY